MTTEELQIFTEDNWLVDSRYVDERRRRRENVAGHRRQQRLHGRSHGRDSESDQVFNTRTSNYIHLARTCPPMKVATQRRRVPPAAAVGSTMLQRP